MRRLLLQSPAFIRAARRLLKKNSEMAPVLHATLESMADDVFKPALKTHKLKGELAGSWASSAGPDLRIVFDFVQHEGAQAIQLLTVGTHDEVY
jgi:mRNA-degrading endonuclease YafQ of YafQ-DinJ toxin-antitoxin module